MVEGANAARPRKTCFVIGPLGAPGSETRDRADLVLRAIVQAALGARYKVDHNNSNALGGATEPPAINAVLEADLVIADLSGLDPTVFYLIGLRDMAAKPIIHLCPSGQSIPFDLQDVEPIYYDARDAAGNAQAVAALRQESVLAAAPALLRDTPGARAGRARRIERGEFPPEIVEALRGLTGHPDIGDIAAEIVATWLRTGKV